MDACTARRLKRHFAHHAKRRQSNKQWAATVLGKFRVFAGYAPGVSYFLIVITDSRCNIEAPLSPRIIDSHSIVRMHSYAMHDVRGPHVV